LTHFLNIMSITTKANNMIENAVIHGGNWAYAMMFIILFTGAALVFTAPALPSTSLIFLITSLAAAGLLNPILSFLVLAAAICFGDIAAYWLGYHIGFKLKDDRNFPHVKKEYFEKTQRIYSKADLVTMIFARFTPIVGSLAQLVAGAINYRFKSFLSKNLLAGIVWLIFYYTAGWIFAVTPQLGNNHVVMFLLVPIVSTVLSLGYYAIKNFGAFMLTKQQSN
jgi:membrane-associated protein